MKFLGIQFILNVLSQYTERITIFQVYYNSELNSFRSLRDPQTERNNSSIISTVFKEMWWSYTFKFKYIKIQMHS